MLGTGCVLQQEILGLYARRGELGFGGFGLGGFWGVRDGENIGHEKMIEIWDRGEVTWGRLRCTSKFLVQTP